MRSPRRAAPARPLTAARLAAILLSAAAVLPLGCTSRGGAAGGVSEEKRLRIEPLAVLPAGSLGEPPLARLQTWVQTQQTVRAAEQDESLVVTNLSRFPASRLGTATQAADAHFNRAVAVAKGQSKRFEQQLFVPANVTVDDFGASQTGGAGQRVMLRQRISDRRFGLPVADRVESIAALADYQSIMVVLGEQAEQHAFWPQLNCVRWPADDYAPEVTVPYPCVVISREDARRNLPTQLYGWLSTSTICWNDLPDDELTEQQQTAVLDWLHFGGRLIVNGPESIGPLANSFLSEHLPISSLAAVAGEGESAAVERLNRFSLPRAKTTMGQADFLSEDFAPAEDDAVSDDRPTAELYEPKPLERLANADGIMGATLADGAAWVPGCEGLLAEWRVGAGRVCMTTFDLADVNLVQWPSYGNFLHSCAFRLPPRRWNSASMSYDFAGADFGEAARAFSRLRLLGRDQVDSLSSGNRTPNVPPSPTTRWGEDGLFAKVALPGLSRASAVKIPPLDSLRGLLLGYLILLVPVNWAVFRVLGKAEWAWFAIPVLAIGGSVYFVRELQLQVGFERRQEAVGLLELHDGYRRGVLTQYFALSTSLSDRFAMRYPDGRGVVGPSILPPGGEPVEYQNLDAEGSGIAGLPIRSHTTSVFHSEETTQLSGVVQWSSAGGEAAAVVRNATDLAIRDAFLIRRRGDVYDHYWVGDLSPGGEFVRSDVRPIDRIELLGRIRGLASAERAAEAGVGTATADPIVRDLDLLSTVQFLPGQSEVLLGWIDHSPTGLKVTPAGDAGSARTYVHATRWGGGWDKIIPDSELPPPFASSL